MQTESILKAFLQGVLQGSDDAVRRPFRDACDYLASVRRGETVFATLRMALECAPLVEMACAWTLLRGEDARVNFLMHCQSRVRHSTDFRGTIFEMLMASRFLTYDSWNWAESPDTTRKVAGGLVDFWVGTSEGTVAIECTSRHPGTALELKHLQQAVDDKSQHKFRDLSYLPQPVARTAVYYEATRTDFTPPSVLDTLDDLALPSSVGGVAVTWRELVPVEGGHCLRPRYEWKGRSISVRSLAVEIRNRVLFVRNYVEPEPSFTITGDVEQARPADGQEG